jgi:hypothetical protein
VCKEGVKIWIICVKKLSRKRQNQVHLVLLLVIRPVPAILSAHSDLKDSYMPEAVVMQQQMERS